MNISQICRSTISLVLFRRSSSGANDKLLKILNSMSSGSEKIKTEASAKVPKLVKQKIVRRKRKENERDLFSPGVVNLQVLGSGCKGAPASIYLFSDQSRYLFNCGEGTQRLAHEHKIKLTRLEHIFMTRASWERIGGLPGLCLTVQESGVRDISLHGPSGIDEMFSATQRFVVLRDLTVEVPYCEDLDSYEDNVLKVQYVHIYRDKNPAIPAIETKDELTEDLTSNNTLKDELEENQDNPAKRLKLDDITIYEDPKIKLTKRFNRAIANSNEESSLEDVDSSKSPVDSSSEIEKHHDDSSGRVLLDDTDYFGGSKKNNKSKKQKQYVTKSRNEEHYVMAFLCKLKERPGHLNLEKCVELGVPPGPLLGRLKSGKDIELKDGSVVKADDVRSPTDPGAAFIFVDIPSEDYLNSLATCEHFAKYQRTATVDSDMALAVVHFTPQEIVRTKIYKEFIEKFAVSTRHIILNERNEFSGCEASHRIQWQLNQLHPEIFPLLKEIAEPRTRRKRYFNRCQKNRDASRPGCRLRGRGRGRGKGNHKERRHFNFDRSSLSASPVSEALKVEENEIVQSVTMESPRNCFIEENMKLNTATTSTEIEIADNPVLVKLPPTPPTQAIIEKVLDKLHNHEAVTLVKCLNLEESCNSSMDSFSAPESPVDRFVSSNETEYTSDSTETFDSAFKAIIPVDHLQKVNPLSYFHLRPSLGLDRQHEPSMCPSAYLAETAKIPGFNTALEEFQQKVLKDVPNLNRASSYPKIVFLGTGSCIPNKTRNVSAILVHINENSCMLLDCGEGTYSQLCRFYGNDKIPGILNKLKAIYISHLHADHHLGLFDLLQKRRKINKEKLFLLAPRQIYHWLHLYDLRVERLKDTFELIHNDNMMLQPLDDERVRSLGLKQIQTCLVRHCPHAFGIAIEMDNNSNAEFLKDEERLKVTYSGDTMPADYLLKIGKNSTVLIHEATMEDDLEYEAKCKSHSTISQAIEQGKKMEAKYTILTHFSQRYAKIPRMENVDNNVGIAFDNMELTMNDLPLLHMFIEPLKLMFNEHCQDMEQKALKRQYKQERVKEIQKEEALKAEVNGGSYTQKMEVDEENGDLNKKPKDEDITTNGDSCSAVESIIENFKTEVEPTVKQKVTVEKPQLTAIEDEKPKSPSKSP